MKVRSKEVTYEIAIEQVFFEDDSEFIIRTGWATGGGSDIDIEIEWVGDVPEWAQGMTAYELSELNMEERNN